MGWGRSPRAQITVVTPPHQARASVHAGGVMTVRSKENTCSANPKSATRARAQKPWSARGGAENLAESSGTEKGFAGAPLASPLKGLGHRAHTCGERHGGTEQTAHRQRTDSAQTTHRQRTDSAQRLSCVFRKRKRRFKSDQP